MLGIVSVAGFDLDEEKGYVKLFASITNPLGMEGRGQEDGGGSGGSSSFWVLEATGLTVFQAVKNLELVSTRELRWSHVDVVLFSEKLAREKGISQILDFFDRERQSRLISLPLLVQGDFKKFMESMYPLEQNSGEALVKQVRSIRMESANLPETESLLELFQRLSQEGRELVLPWARFVQGDGEGEEGYIQPGTPNPAKISGSALFRGDKLQDFFNDRETAGYLWLTGNLDRATYVLECPGDREAFLSIEVYEAATKVEPFCNDGEFRFKVSVRAEGRIQDFNCQNPERWDKEYVAGLNRRLATAIRNQMEMSLDKAREAGTDVFGLGNLLYRRCPGKWKEMGDSWGEIFPAVAVDIEVETIIRRHGLVRDRFKIN